MAAIDFLEDGRDRADRHVLDGLAKLGDRGEVAVAVLGPEVGDADRPLERPRAAHQLAEDDPQRLRGQRALAGGQGLGDDLVLARGRPDLEPLILLDLADLRGDLGAAIQQADEVLVEPVDLAPQARQTGLPLGVGRLREQGPDPSGSGRVDCVRKTSGSSVDSAKDGRKDRSVHFPRGASSESPPLSPPETPTLNKPTQVCLK